MTRYMQVTSTRMGIYYLQVTWECVKSLRGWLCCAPLHDMLSVIMHRDLRRDCIGMNDHMRAEEAESLRLNSTSPRHGTLWDRDLCKNREEDAIGIVFIASLDK